jgi:malate synthase
MMQSSRDHDMAGDTLAGSGIGLHGRLGPGYDTVLTAPALNLLAELHRRFEPARQKLLAARRERQARFDAGELPDFRADTRAIREGDWCVAPIPAALQDRRIEITGPVDRKMIINALNSARRCSWPTSRTPPARPGPTWWRARSTCVTRCGHDRVHVAPTARLARHYALKPDARTVLFVRPRGWHLPEKHLRVDGQPISGGLFDLALFASAQRQRAAREGTAARTSTCPSCRAMEEARSGTR